MLKAVWIVPDVRKDRPTSPQAKAVTRFGLTSAPKATLPYLVVKHHLAIEWERLGTPVLRISFRLGIRGGRPTETRQIPKTYATPQK